MASWEEAEEKRFVAAELLQEALNRIRRANKTLKRGDLNSIEEKIKDIADDRVKETRLTLLREEREETSYLYQWGWYWYPKKGTSTPLQLVKSYRWHQYVIEALQEAVDENQLCS